MKELILTSEEIGKVNASREAVANAGFLAISGPCAVDCNQITANEYATAFHLEHLSSAISSNTDNITLVGRLAGEKPRSNLGLTGLIHQPGGVKIYLEIARQLHALGIPLAAEIMEESGLAIAGPHISVGWTGARNDHDTGPRYLLRPTDRDVDLGINAILGLIKCGQDGGLEGAFNSIQTIMSEVPESRTRFTIEGIKTVTTYANPNVGVILRGSKHRPSGLLDEILADEIIGARNKLDSEFGVGAVKLLVDTSHAHASYEGGGELGQLMVARSLGQLITDGLHIDGIMMESYILPGNQPDHGTIPGLSTKDECLGQMTSAQVLRDIDLAVGESLTTAA